MNCGSNCPETIMVGTNCIAMFDETGETIILNQILKEENIAPQKGIPLTLSKIRGRYFVVGKDFKNLWMLTPVKNSATVKKIPLPAKKLTLPPVFEISDGNLLMRGQQNEYIYVYDIDKNSWKSSTIKAGE
jgi:hypothetical protein